MSDFYKDLGAAIRQARTEFGIDRQELAVRSGVNKPTLNMIERGSQSVRVDQLVAIAEALDVPPQNLIPRTKAAKLETLMHRVYRLEERVSEALGE